MAPRPAHLSEDYQGRYWRAYVDDRGPWLVREMLCSDPGCIDPVVIRREADGRYRWRHVVWPPDRLSTPTSSWSGRPYEDWQDAAADAARAGVIRSAR